MPPSSIFITVGTTEFESFISAVLSETFLHKLSELGVKTIRLQIGRGSLPTNVQSAYSSSPFEDISDKAESFNHFFAYSQPEIIKKEGFFVQKSLKIPSFSRNLASDGFIIFVVFFRRFLGCFGFFPRFFLFLWDEYLKRLFASFLRFESEEGVAAGLGLERIHLGGGVGGEGERGGSKGEEGRSEEEEVEGGDDKNIHKEKGEEEEEQKNIHKEEVERNIRKSAKDTHQKQQEKHKNIQKADLTQQEDGKYKTLKNPSLLLDFTPQKTPKSHLFSDFSLAEVEGVKLLRFVYQRETSFPSDSPSESSANINSPPLSIEIFRYKKGLLDDFLWADAVFTHGGSGTLLDLLYLSSPPLVFVVINPLLLHNHQVELAEELFSKGFVCAVFSSPEEMLSLQTKDIKKIIENSMGKTRTLPKADLSAFYECLAELIGVYPGISG